MCIAASHVPYLAVGSCIGECEDKKVPYSGSYIVENFSKILFFYLTKTLVKIFVTVVSYIAFNDGINISFFL